MIELVKSAFSAGLNWLYIILCIVGALLLLGLAIYGFIKTSKTKMPVLVKIALIFLVVVLLAVAYYFDLLFIINSIRAI